MAKVNVANDARTLAEKFEPDGAIPIVPLPGCTSASYSSSHR